MDVPGLAFVLMVVVMGFAERSYFTSVASVVPGINPDERWANEVRQNPSRLPHIVFSETKARLIALATRQLRPEVERKRRLALASIAVTLACFVWVTWF